MPGQSSRHAGLRQPLQPDRRQRHPLFRRHRGIRTEHSANACGEAMAHRRERPLSRTSAPAASPTFSRASTAPSISAPALIYGEAMAPTRPPPSSSRSRAASSTSRPPAGKPSTSAPGVGCGEATGPRWERPSSGALAPTAEYLTVVNGTVYFSASDRKHGRELWRSNARSDEDTAERGSSGTSTAARAAASRRSSPRSAGISSSRPETRGTAGSSGESDRSRARRPRGSAGRRDARSTLAPAADYGAAERGRFPARPAASSSETLSTARFRMSRRAGADPSPRERRWAAAARPSAW